MSFASSVGSCGDAYGRTTSYWIGFDESVALKVMKRGFLTECADLSSIDGTYLSVRGRDDSSFISCAFGWFSW